MYATRGLADAISKAVRIAFADSTSGIKRVRPTVTPAASSLRLSAWSVASTSLAEITWGSRIP